MTTSTGSALRWVGYAVAAAILAGTGVLVYNDRYATSRPAADTHIAPPPQVPGPVVNRWREAARKVEEDRGVPMGRRARVGVPAELLHYADRRRFLAVQVAGWREEGYELPHDEAGLVKLIQSDGLVEVRPVGDTYVLYGVGANADEGPITHYDVRTGQEVVLYPSWAEFDDARQGVAPQIDAKKEETLGWRAEARKLARTAKNRRRRTELTRQIRSAEADIKSLQRRVAFEASYYEAEEKRRELVGEWELLAAQARGMEGRSYDLSKGTDRRAFRARLLSFIRPQAHAVMMEIAQAYSDRFSRPLAFTSLVRSQHYQRQLGETNANATRIDVPPHTTALAFDIFYRYMSAEEQEMIMGLIAGMERAGRLEALRENRDHFHLFVFADGDRPDERLIAEALGDVGAGRRVAAAPRAQRRLASGSRSGRQVASGRRATARRTAVSPRRSGTAARRTTSARRPSSSAPRRRR